MKTPKTSGRIEAEKLFADGLLPDSDEVLALSLAKSTRERYHRDWKAKQAGGAATATAVVEIVAPSVKVGSLQLRQLFFYQNFKYRVNFFRGDQVHILLVELAPSGGYEIERQGRYLPADTEVSLK